MSTRGGLAMPETHINELHQSKSWASLEDRVVIITGAAGVIGRTLCLGLARAGARIVAADLVEPESVVEEIEAQGGRGVAVQVDITEPDATESLADQAIDRFGRIDVLVNNAGFFRAASRGGFADIPLEEWDQAFRVNVRGSWLCSRAVLPAMRRQGSGRIIHVGSNTVFRGVPGFLHYVTSKSALTGMTRAMASELGPDGISVNLLCPDFIPDPDLLAAQPGNNERLVAQRCFKRTQEPEDLVGGVLFLAGPGSDFVTGQSLVVNGGAYFL
ncbi:SDR family NAD(P)-dependent oxidoreductase [Saccharopolyspora shandongensis]|uniref:SDR family NAD(P)-dependent oxidoreductase n=1 Tax=Saccharopolyspora shandongensis TaxID=418495 RepID=UPI00340FCE56